MARAHRVALITAAFTTVYILALLAIIPVPFVEEKTAQQILPAVSCLPYRPGRIAEWPGEQIPWWLLVSFGSYALWSLGWGVFTFRDCPEAYTELLSVRARFYIVGRC
jgi:dolichyl-phosphate mannosyltransferase polypeptide 3